MTTPHVLDLLPQWVEGDLSSLDRAHVQAHLALCPSCRVEADHFSTSQAWLREALATPFEAADRDRLRRSVMDQIRAESAPDFHGSFRPRPAILAACAAALLVATLTWRQERPSVMPHPEPQTTAPTTATPARAEPPLHSTHRNTARAAPHPTRESTPAAQNGPSRIEFRTSDPTVRIIWLARATPLPDTTLPIQEAP